MKAHIVGVTAIEDPAYKRPWNGRNHHLQHTKPHLGSVQVERNIVYTCFKHPNMWKRLILWPCPWCVDVCHKNDTLSQMSGRAWCHGKARHRMAKYGTAMAWHSMAALPTNTNTILPPAQTSLTRLHPLFQFFFSFFSLVMQIEVN